MNYFSKKEQAELLKDMSQMEETCDNLDEALSHAQNSLIISNNIPENEILKSEIYLIIGIIYRKRNNFNNALKYLKKSLNVIFNNNLNNKNNTLILAEIYNQLGALYISKYIHKKEASVAKEYFFKASKLLEKIEMSACDLARFKWKQARISMFQELNYQKTLNILEEVIKICEKNCKQDLYLKGRIYGYYGGSLIRINKPNKAIKN